MLESEDQALNNILAEINLKRRGMGRPKGATRAPRRRDSVDMFLEAQ